MMAGSVVSRSLTVAEARARRTTCTLELECEHRVAGDGCGHCSPLTSNIHRAAGPRPTARDPRAYIASRSSVRLCDSYTSRSVRLTKLSTPRQDAYLSGRAANTRVRWLRPVAPLRLRRPLGWCELSADGYRGSQGPALHLLRPSGIIPIRSVSTTGAIPCNVEFGSQGKNHSRAPL